MTNLNLPKWAKEAPQTFKCHLAQNVFNEINLDLDWFFNRWVMDTREFSKLTKDPMSIVRESIEKSCVRVATDNYWNILHRNKSDLAKEIGLPILTAHSLDYAGVGQLIAKHLIDAIRHGDITVQIKYKYRIGSYVFLPTLQLVTNGYSLRLDQNLGRAVKVTRAFHNFKDIQSRTALTELIYKHRDYYYGPYVSASQEAQYVVPRAAIEFTEK